MTRVKFLFVRERVHVWAHDRIFFLWKIWILHMFSFFVTLIFFAVPLYYFLFLIVFSFALFQPPLLSFLFFRHGRPMFKFFLFSHTRAATNHMSKKKKKNWANKKEEHTQKNLLLAYRRERRCDPQQKTKDYLCARGVATCWRWDRPSTSGTSTTEERMLFSQPRCAMR